MAFLSTLSLRRATFLPAGLLVPRWSISIHALLAESDGPEQLRTVRVSNFYPRSPCGERPGKSTTLTRIAYISIHALLAESDEFSMVKRKTIHISIHALLAESDLFWQRLRLLDRYFYPRSPCGERPRDGAVDAKNQAISIHALLAESD